MKPKPQARVYISAYGFSQTPSTVCFRLSIICPFSISFTKIKPAALHDQKFIIKNRYVYDRSAEYNMYQCKKKFLFLLINVINCYCKKGNKFAVVADGC